MDSLPGDNAVELATSRLSQPHRPAPLPLSIRPSPKKTSEFSKWSTEVLLDAADAALLGQASTAKVFASARS